MHLSTLSWKLCDKMFTYILYKQIVLTQKLTGLQWHNGYVLWCVHIMLHPTGYPNNWTPFHSRWAPLWWFNVPGSKKRYYAFIQSDRHFCPILTKFGISRPIFMKFPNTKFHENQSCKTCPDTCRQKGRQTNAYDESNRHLS